MGRVPQPLGAAVFTQLQTDAPQPTAQSCEALGETHGKDQRKGGTEGDMVALLWFELLSLCSSCTPSGSSGDAGHSGRDVS